MRDWTYYLISVPGKTRSILDIHPCLMLRERGLRPLAVLRISGVTWRDRSSESIHAQSQGWMRHNPMNTHPQVYYSTINSTHAYGDKTQSIRARDTRSSELLTENGVQRIKLANHKSNNQIVTRNHEAHNTKEWRPLTCHANASLFLYGTHQSLVQSHRDATTAS